MGIQIIGPEKQVSGSPWAPIQFNGYTGWVNRNYLAHQLGSVDEAVAAQAVVAIQALKSRDFETLASLVHPELGIRFSPYTFVSPDDLVFSAGQVRTLPFDQTRYRWGHFDGSGEPIELIFQRLLLRFVYDVDFTRPHRVGYNEFIGGGNTINNIIEFYPNATTVEYHLEGSDPRFGGMDWRSLRLIFEEKAGVWYLVGIVHDEWTT